MIYFSASDSCHVPVQYVHLENIHVLHLTVSDVPAVPTGAALLWRLIGLSVGGVCWWQPAPGGSFVTNIIQCERGVNKFYIARITLLFDSIGGPGRHLRASFPWDYTANCVATRLTA